MTLHGIRGVGRHPLTIDFAGIDPNLAEWVDTCKVAWDF
jgi:hypothetical protein